MGSKGEIRIGLVMSDYDEQENCFVQIVALYTFVYNVRLAMFA